MGRGPGRNSYATRIRRLLDADGRPLSIDRVATEVGLDTQQTAAVLARLTKLGMLRRVRRGVYATAATAPTSAGPGRHVAGADALVLSTHSPRTPSTPPPVTKTLAAWCQQWLDERSRHTSASTQQATDGDLRLLGRALAWAGGTPEPKRGSSAPKTMGARPATDLTDEALEAARHAVEQRYSTWTVRRAWSTWGTWVNWLDEHNARATGPHDGLGDRPVAPGTPTASPASLDGPNAPSVTSAVPNALASGPYVAHDAFDELWHTWERDAQRAERAEEQLAALTANYDQVQAALADALEELAATKTPTPVGDLRSVAEAVDAVAEVCPYIEVHPDAYQSAAECVYRRPDMVVRDLLALNDVVATWRHRGLPAGLAAACREAGVDWRNGVSDTAAQQFRQDYEHVIDGAVQFCAPHIARGANAPPTLHVRMHFWVDSEAKRVVLCYIGKHLRDATNR